MRDGDWKYLRIASNEFRFDVAQDPREGRPLRRGEPAAHNTAEQLIQDLTFPLRSAFCFAATAQGCLGQVGHLEN